MNLSRSQEQEGNNLGGAERRGLTAGAAGRHRSANDAATSLSSSSRLGASPPPPPRPTVIEADGGRRRRPPALHCTVLRSGRYSTGTTGTGTGEGRVIRTGFLSPLLFSLAAQPQPQSGVGTRQSLSFPWSGGGGFVHLITCALWGPSGSTGRETLRVAGQSIRV